MSRTPTPSDLLKVREWRKQTPAAGELLVSSSPALLDREWITTAFGTEDMYWAKPLPREQLDLMLGQSLTLGMYQTSSFPPSVPARVKTADSPSSPRTPSPTLEGDGEGGWEQIGMARLVTDYVTFVYMTDVYILPQHRKDGLGKWLVSCCREIVEGVPELRRAMLLTSPEVGRRFYERELGWWDVGGEREHLACMTIKGWGFGGS